MFFTALDGGRPRKTRVSSQIRSAKHSALDAMLKLVDRGSRSIL
jgi:hypothetical protein